MGHVLRCGGLILSLVLLTAAFATGQQVPGKPGAVAPAAPMTGDISGKVAIAGGSSRSLTVAVETQVYEPNPAAKRDNTGNRQVDTLMRRQMEIQRDQVEIMRARSPQERMRRMAELQRDMAMLQREMARLNVQPQQQPFKTVTKRQDYDIATDDKTHIRFVEPPVAFDDKGNPKKYTAAELKELKGTDARLLGYKGEFEQLRPGHVVKVTLGKRAATKAGKDLDKDPVADDKPYAVLILVTGEDTPPNQPKKKK